MCFYSTYHLPPHDLKLLVYAPLNAYLCCYKMYAGVCPQLFLILGWGRFSDNSAATKSLLHVPEKVGLDECYTIIQILFKKIKIEKRLYIYIMSQH